MKSIDLIEDISFPAQRNQLIKNSSAYKAAVENDIDTDLIEGKQPDKNSGVVKFEPIDETEQRLFMKDVANFFLKEVPKDMLVSVGKGTVNLGHFLNNIAYALDPNPDEMDDQAYQGVYDNLNKVKQSLSNFADEDSPFVSKIVGMLGQSQMYTYPIYQKLNKAGLPKGPSLIISSAMSEALAFDKSETFFTDSKYFRAVKETFNLPDDTPMGEVVDKFMQFGEYLAYTAVGEKLLAGIIEARKLKADKAQQGSIAVGGGAGSGAVLDKMTPDNENLTESEEKKTLNFDDQSMVPGTVNEYGFEKTAGIVPVFKSMLKETAKKLPNKGSGEQILNTLKNTPGVKQQELKWSGLDDFLKEKKTATKEEVKEYLENNSLDVSEVKFGSDVKTLKLSEDVEFKKNEFERKVLADIYKKDPEMRGEVPEELLEDINYDIFTPIAMTADGVKEKVMPMDFNTMRTILGENPNIANFKKLDNGNLRDLNTPEDDFVNKGYFEITPFDFEKYQVEEAVRKFRQNDVKAPKFDSTKYNEPGGEDYKELIFKLKGEGYPLEFDDYSLGKTKTKFPYKSPEVHFGTKNEFAHVRFKTRDLDGQKILAVEEMQSDLVTDMKSAYSGQVTDFPFKNNWYELVSKRLIRYAADNDFDAVAIPKARVIQDRYNLTKRVESIQIGSFDEKRKLIGIDGYDIDSGTLQISEQFTFADAEKKFGKENFEHILEKARKFTQDDYDEYDTVIDLLDDFTFGGEGKDALYNKTIPSFLKKYGKKWNAKVYDDEIGFDFDSTYGSPKKKGIPVTIIQLTDEMKKSVQEDGQALFNIFGIGTGATVGTKAVLDNTRNNTISN